MSTRHKTLVAVLLVPLALVLSLLAVNAADALTSHGQAATSQVQPAKQKPTITISSFAFQTPKKVKPGAKIKVVNEDSVEHTVTSDTDGIFNVDVPANSTVMFTAPTTKGSYPFHCAIHTFMKGTLKVK